MTPTVLARRVLSFIVVCAIVPFIAVVLAAELDASWLAGKWEATAPSPAGAGQDKFQLTVKPDGTFEESNLSARGGQIYVVGKWQVAGETAILEGVYQGGPPSINTMKRTLMLRRSGDNLEGTRFAHRLNQTLPIAYTRAK